METTFIYDHFVTGKDFVGRRSEVQSLVSILRSEGNAAIFEPAKAGKTSLIRQALQELRISGTKYTVVECSLLGVRTVSAICSRISDSLCGVFAGTPSEKAEFTSRYIAPGNSAETLVSLFEAPYRIASDRSEFIIFVFNEFQDILDIPEGEKRLKDFEAVVKRSTASCSFIWSGSQVNSMKYIFEQHKFFFRNSERVRLSDVTYPEVENYVNKRFLSNGKVIEKEIIADIYGMVRGNLWYINHFCAICDALSRGYIVIPIVQESIASLLSIHEPRFISMMHELTTFQTLLLKAIVTGETRFSSEHVIEAYGLNSSANVRRLKDALCKKEIITFEDSERAVILDPLFEYWLREVYFG